MTFISFFFRVKSPDKKLIINVPAINQTNAEKYSPITAKNINPPRNTNGRAKIRMLAKIPIPKTATININITPLGWPTSHQY